MLVIDGYNLLYQFFLPAENVEQLTANRQKLLKLMKDYCHKKKKKALVFYDAKTPLPPSYAEAGDQNVKISYVEDADKAIIELISKTKDKTSLVIITSDRKISDLARKNGFKVVSSWAFKKELKPGLKLKRYKKVDTLLSPEEVKKWMRFLKRGLTETNTLNISYFPALFISTTTLKPIPHNHIRCLKSITYKDEAFGKV